MKGCGSISYDTQCLLASLTGAGLPENVPAESIDGTSLLKKLDSGKAAVNAVKESFAQRNVPFPMTDVAGDTLTVFVLDLEGTLTPLPYAKKVVFPQMMAHMGAYLATAYPGSEELRALVKEACTRSDELKAAFTEDAQHNFMSAEASEKVRQLFHAHIQKETAERSARTYVKETQGNTWVDFVAQQDTPVQTKLFNDVAPFVRERGARAAKDASSVFVYSTASVKLQQAFLSCSRDGDLDAFITGYVDPSMVGPKVFSDSYVKLRRHVSKVLARGRETIRIVFCTDSPSEASAALSSNEVDAVTLLVRPGNEWVPQATFEALRVPSVASFGQLMAIPRPVDYGKLAAELKEF